jgi:hypothetical protein
MRDLKVLTLVKAKRIDNGEWVKGELITNGLGKDKHKILFILPEDANEFNFDLRKFICSDGIVKIARDIGIVALKLFGMN